MILVTGGTGLVGSHLLCRLVKNNLKIRALYRSDAKIEVAKSVFSLYADMPEHAFETIEWFKADINTLPQLHEAFKGVTHVYHCAAMVSFDENSYKTMRKVNIEGTANIVNLSIAHRIKKLCYVSSIATLGESHGDNYITEATHWNADVTNNSYAITKYGAEMEVWRGTQEGLPMVMVNPGVILGAGFWNDGTGRLFPLVENGFKYFTQGIVGFVAVEDVVEAMVQLMNHSITNKRYILVSENWSYKKLLTQIAETLNVAPPRRAIKPWILKLAWRLNWLMCNLTRKPGTLTKHTVRSLLSINRYSNEAIKKELNFEFTPIAECLETIGKHFKARPTT